jgi:hypothetical protein
MDGHLAGDNAQNVAIIWGTTGIGWANCQFHSQTEKIEFSSTPDWCEWSQFFLADQAVLPPPSTSTSMDERLSSLKLGVEEKRGLWVEDKKIDSGPF